MDLSKKIYSNWAFWLDLNTQTLFYYRHNCVVRIIDEIGGKISGQEFFWIIALFFTLQCLHVIMLMLKEKDNHKLLVISWTNILFMIVYIRVASTIAHRY